jgi:hypothetical protein
LKTQFPEELLLEESDVSVINLSCNTIMQKNEKVEETEEISNQNLNKYTIKSLNMRFNVPDQSQHLQMH